MTVAEILKAAEKYADEYDYIGIRTQEVPFELGSVDHDSSVWEDGEETNGCLDGISVTSIKSKAVVMHSSEASVRSGRYFGKHAAIIVGSCSGYGEDEGELILRDAEVVEILS